MSTSVMSGPGRKILKVIGIVLGCLLALILIISILLLTVLEPYAERFLKKQVAEKSDGLYQLQFDDLHIDLFTTTLRLENVHLEPDSATYQRQLQQGKASPMLLEIESPLFELAGINLMDALLRNKLNIRTISLQKPHITILKDTRAATDDASEANGGGNAAGGFIESLYLGEISVTEASIQYLLRNEQLVPQHSIPELSLLLEDLEIELPNKNDSLSWALDDLQLEAKNYSYHSPDSVYHFRLGLLSYGTKDGTLLLEAAALEPRREVNNALGPQQASRYLYSLRVPRLELQDLHLLEAYNTQELQLEQFKIEQAALEVLEDPSIPRSQGGMDMQELYNSFSGYLQTLGIEELRFENTYFIYRSIFEEPTPIHEIQRATLVLDNIRIDSSTLFHPREHSPVQDILFQAAGYSHQHPQTPYTIAIGQAELSSKDKLLQLDSISVLGDRVKNEQLKQQGKAVHMLYTLFTPQFRLTAFDPIKAFQQSSLQLATLEISEPTIDVLVDKQVAPPEPDSLLSSVYQGMSNFIKYIQLDEINIPKATFTQHLRRRGGNLLVQNLEQASLRLKGIMLDSAFFYAQNPRLPLEEIRLTAHQYSLRPADDPKIYTLGRLHYSSREEVLSARSIDIRTNGQTGNSQKGTAQASRNSFDLSAPFFRVTGLDLVTAMNSEKLAIDEIIIREPEVAVLQNRDVPKEEEDSSSGSQPLQGLFRWVDPVTVNRIRLEDGTFTLREKRDEITRTQLLEHASATFTGIALSPNKVQELGGTLPLEEMVLTARDYTYQSPDSVYRLTLDSLHYSTRHQVLTARTFQLSSDKEAHEQLKKENMQEASRNLFDIYARTFRINGLDLVQAYETGRFNMQELLLTKPQLSVLQDQNVAEAKDAEEEDTTASAEEKEGNNSQRMEQVAEVLETFRIGMVRIEDGQVQVNILKDSVQRSQTLEHVSIALDNLRLTSLEAPDPLDMFTVDDMGILLKDYTLLTPDSLYQFHVKQVSTSLGNSSLQIDSIRLRPLLKRDKFVEQLEYEDDRFDITVPSVTMLGVDFDLLYNYQDLFVRKILIEDPEFQIYRDKRIEMDPERRPGTLQDALLQLPITVTIDSIALTGGLLTYSEVAPNGVEPGVVTLAETKILLMHVTNDSLLIQENPLVIADAESMFMDESKLKVLFTFHLDHPEDLHTYEGSLEPMKFKAFNPAFEKLMFVRMESGLINKAEFSVRATEHITEGQMRFLYKDLEIQLLDKHDPENPGFLRNAGSFLLNTLVIKDNNPTKLFNNFRKGDIDTERDYQKSIFNHMSQAMLSGITSSVVPGLVEAILEATVGFP